jgi:hypothetical protein
MNVIYTYTALITFIFQYKIHGFFCLARYCYQYTEL